MIDSFTLITAVPPSYGGAQHRRMQEIAGQVPGDADHRQDSLFRHILALTGFRRMLMLGLPSARETCFLLDAARGRRTLAVTCVDAFQALPRETAEQTILPFLHGSNVRLLPQAPDAFLASAVPGSAPELFDLIYVGADSGFMLAPGRPAQLAALLAPGGLIAGRLPEGGADALRQTMPGHLVYAGALFLAGPRQLPA